MLHSPIATDGRGKLDQTASVTPPSDRRNCHAISNDGSILFQIVPVKIYGKNKVIFTYAFVDDGANVSMLDNNIARDLDLHGKRETLSLQWLNEHCVSHNTEKIDFTISGI